MLSGLFSRNKLVAIDIGGSSVKLAEVDYSPRGPVLKKFVIQPMAQDAISGGEINDIGAVALAIEIVLKDAKTKRKNAVSALWGNSIIVKKISMPKMEESLVAEQIKWEAEQYIPFDINEVSLEHHILRGTHGRSEGMEVLLVAAKQDFMFKVLESVEMAKLKCAIVDVAGFALANCFEQNYGVTDQPVALLNIGAGITNFVVVEKGEVVFCRDMIIGGSNYTQEVTKAMGVSFEEAEALKLSASMGQEVPEDVNSVLAATNEQVVDEVRNGFEFFSATSSGAAISKFYVSGGSMFVPGLVEQIASSVACPYEVLDPFRKVLYDVKAFTPDYISQIKSISPIVLGLGMRKMADR